jgi:hypothetical protein
MAIANLGTAIKTTYKAPSAKYLPAMSNAACGAISSSLAIMRRVLYADMARQIG